MDIYVGGIQSGKTTGLIKQSALTKSIIVAPTFNMAKYIQTMAFEMNLEIPTPITIHEFIKRKFYSGLRDTDRYLIDELQMILHSMNVDTATVNRESIYFVDREGE